MRKNYDILMIDKKFLLKKMELPTVGIVDTQKKTIQQMDVGIDDKEPDDDDIDDESDDYKTGFCAGYEAGTQDSMKKE
jgi:hypothetical protein